MRGLSESVPSKYYRKGSSLPRKSTLAVPTLLDPSETSGSLGTKWLKQRQHYLNTFQVYSLCANLERAEREKILSAMAGPTPKLSRYTCRMSSKNSTMSTLWIFLNSQAKQPCELELWKICWEQSTTWSLGILNYTQKSTQANPMNKSDLRKRVFQQFFCNISNKLPALVNKRVERLSNDPFHNCIWLRFLQVVTLHVNLGTGNFQRFCPKFSFLH